MKASLRKLTFLGLVLPLAALLGQSFDFERTAASINVGVSVRGAWGPDQIPLRVAYIAVNYKPMAAPVCSPMMMHSIRANSSGAFGCSNGRPSARPVLQTDVETTGNRGAEAILMVPMAPFRTVSGIVPPNSAYTPPELGALSILRTLVIPPASGNQSLPEGQLYFKVLPDFKVEGFYEFGGQRISRPLNIEKGIVLLQYYLETPETPLGGSWMRFYDLLVDYPGSSSGVRYTASYFGYDGHGAIQAVSYDRENKRYVFQIFVRTHSEDAHINESLQNFRFGFARKDWGSLEDQMVCTRGDCIIDPLRSFQAQLPGRHGALSYRMNGPLVLPARLSYRLATKDQAGRPVDISELELKVTAQRRGDGRRVNSTLVQGRWNPYTTRMLVERPGVSYGNLGPLVTEARALLNLDDVDSARYVISISVVYRGVEYASDSIGPGNPIEAVTLVGSAPGASGPLARPTTIFTSAHPSWQTYTVGKGFTDTWQPNTVFDHYPVYEVLFRKPAAQRETLRFELAPESLPGTLSATARRTSDGRVFESVASGAAAVLMLEDAPGATYQLSVRVNYQNRTYEPGQSPGAVRPGGQLQPTVLSVEVNDSGAPIAARDDRWRAFKLGERSEHVYRVRFAGVLPIRPQPGPGPQIILPRDGESPRSGP